MAMNPRLLRPKASGGPVFTTQGYSRVWGVTTKSTGNVAGTAETDTGYYAVKWWDNTTTVYDSGDPFSKAAAGNQRAFEVYPCDAGGVASGQFDGFDVSDNALTQVRAEDVSLEAADPGSWVWWTYFPGGPAETGDISGNNLSSDALDQFYTDLDAGGGDLFVSGNPGIATDDPTIATAKGYTVFGSVPPSTALLLNFNGSNGSTTFTDSGPNSLTFTAYGNAAISTAQSKFGGASGYFDGNADYIIGDADADLYMDGDFTVECWVYWEGSAPMFQNFVGPNTVFLAAFFRVWGVGAPFAGYDERIGIGNATHDINTGAVVSSSVLPQNQWVHVAATRKNGIVRIFMDGVLEGTGTTDNTVYDFGQNGVVVGTSVWDTTEGYFKGYIDDLRLIKGEALYTANFTPPASQLGVWYP